MLKIRYHKPKHISIDMYNTEDEDITTQNTILGKSSLKKGKTNIPIQPRFHADALYTLAKLTGRNKQTSTFPVAFYLAMLLVKTNEFVVSVKHKELQTDLGLSPPSVVKAIEELEDLEFIKKVGQSSYFISPKLAFYGSNIAWSMALQRLEEIGNLDGFEEEVLKIEKQINNTYIGPSEVKL